MWASLRLLQSAAFTSDPAAAYLGEDGASIVPPPGVECTEALRVDALDGTTLATTTFAGSELPLAIPALWLTKRSRLLSAIDRDLPGSYDPYPRAAKYMRVLRPIEASVGAYSGGLRAAEGRIVRADPECAGAISIARYELELTDAKWAAGVRIGEILPLDSGMRDVPQVPQGEAGSWSSSSRVTPFSP